MAYQYSNSLTLLNRAEKTIPLGSQTFSKSKVSYPKGSSPLFVKRGQGCQVWDVDDNQYTDFGGIVEGYSWWEVIGTGYIE